MTLKILFYSGFLLIFIRNCEPNLESLDTQTLFKTVGAVLIGYWLGEP